MVPCGLKVRAERLARMRSPEMTAFSYLNPKRGLEGPELPNASLTSSSSIVVRDESPSFRAALLTALIKAHSVVSQLWKVFINKNSSVFATGVEDLMVFAKPSHLIESKSCGPNDIAAVLEIFAEAGRLTL